MSSNARLDIVDALRGFALAGIVIVHMVEQFIGSPRHQEVWVVEANLIDQIVMSLNFIFIGGKFFSIFALLFGMSFALMMSSAEARGERFTGRFLWRLFLLLGFGIAHSLIYRGDILTLYVLLGFILPIFYHWKDSWLWWLAGFLFLGLGRVIFLAVTGTHTLLSYDNMPDSPEILRYLQVLQQGSFIEVLEENFRYGFAAKFDFLFGVFGRAYITLGYFLIGMWLVRSQLMANIANYKPQMKKFLWQMPIIAVLCGAVMAALFSVFAKPIDFSSWGPALTMGFYDAANIALTVFLISGFLLLYLRNPQGWMRHFAPYGRMALTAYLTQSIIGVVIFHGWGIGALGKLHDWQTLLLAILVIGLQMAACHWWLTRFRYGPLEWLWRCGTYLKWIPILR
jgi:uncharacterized protein